MREIGRYSKHQLEIYLFYALRPGEEPARLHIMVGRRLQIVQEFDITLK
ncbi:MAG: hypothetical protein QXQ57_04790 [Sulfolobales archaeon]